MRVVILGSGTSFGVPVIGCRCEVCTSTDRRDRRMRTAALVESDDGARILIDTPPELRLQLLEAGIDTVDAVLFTHEHADHVHGIDDLRAISVRRGPLGLYGSHVVMAQIQQRFGYIFDTEVQPPPGTSKPELTVTELVPFEEVSIAGMPVVPLEVDHGGTPVLGYRIGRMCYVTDAKAIPPRARAAMQGLDVLVLNALFEQPHPTHLSIDEAVAVGREVGAKRVFLTHLTHRYAHQALERRLPPGVQPAYDGLTIVF